MKNFDFQSHLSVAKIDQANIYILLLLKSFSFEQNSYFCHLLTAMIFKILYFLKKCTQVLLAVDNFSKDYEKIPFWSAVIVVPYFEISTWNSSLEQILINLCPVFTANTMAGFEQCCPESIWEESQF